MVLGSTLWGVSVFCFESIIWTVKLFEPFCCNTPWISQLCYMRENSRLASEHHPHDPYKLNLSELIPRCPYITWSHLCVHLTGDYFDKCLFSLKEGDSCMWISYLQVQAICINFSLEWLLPKQWYHAKLIWNFCLTFHWKKEFWGTGIGLTTTSPECLGSGSTER